MQSVEEASGLVVRCTILLARLQLLQMELLSYFNQWFIQVIDQIKIYNLQKCPVIKTVNIRSDISDA